MSSGPKPLVPRKAGSIRCYKPIQPQPPDRERRSIAQRRDPVKPLHIRHSAVHRQPTRRRRIGCQDEGSVDLGPGCQADPRHVLTRIHPSDGLAGSDLDPETFEIAPQWGPEATVVIIARHVEEQPLRRAEEIAVEHGDKFAGGEVVGVGEKAAGEDLQRQVPGPGRKMKSIKESRCAFSVVLGERARKVDVQQLQSGRHIDCSKITKPKRGALYHERCEIERRRTRNAGEGVSMAVGGDQRIVGDRH